MSPFSILKHYSVQNVTIFIGHSNLSVDRMSLEMDCLPVQRSILSSDIFFLHSWHFLETFFCIVDDKRVCDSWIFPTLTWLYFCSAALKCDKCQLTMEGKKYWCLIADYYKLIKYNYHFFYCLLSTAMNYPKGSSNQLYWSP